MNMEPNMKPRIALFNGDGMVSWLIKKQTRSKYSHAAMLIPGTTNRIIESREFKGVRLHTLDESDNRLIDWFAIPSMSDEDYNHAISLFLGQLGMPYDYWSVARFVTKKPARENGKWFCSEAVHKMLADAGTRLLLRIPSAEVSPAHLGISPLLVQVAAP
jgi:uncharacterized protein YycO